MSTTTIHCNNCPYKAQMQVISTLVVAIIFVALVVTAINTTIMFIREKDDC